jgi:hypothetical protein
MNQKAKGTDRKERAEIAHETIQIVKQGSYLRRGQKAVVIRDAVEKAKSQTCVYHLEQIPSPLLLFLLLETPILSFDFCALDSSPSTRWRRWVETIIDVINQRRVHLRGTLRRRRVGKRNLLQAKVILFDQMFPP